MFVCAFSITFFISAATFCLCSVTTNVEHNLSGSDDAAANDPVGNFIDVSNDDCSPEVWWNLLYVVCIMEHAYSSAHHLALHKLMVAYERVSGRSIQWEINSKGAVDASSHLVSFLLECLSAQNYVVTEEEILYQPVLSPNGIPYHKELGDMQHHLWRALRSFFAFVQNLGVPSDTLPEEETFLLAIDHLFPKNVIQTACVVIHGGTSRVRMVQRNYHLRAFRNVMVDMHEARVYSPMEARSANLFAYHYLDIDVPLDIVDGLDRVRAFLQTGFASAAEYVKLRSMARELVYGTMFQQFWLFQGYTMQSNGQSDKRCGDIEALMFAYGYYHCSDLRGASWIEDQCFKTDQLIVMISQQGGTGKSAVALELTSCDDKKAIWFVPMQPGNAFVELSGAFGKRAAIAIETKAPVDFKNFKPVSSIVLKTCASREHTPGVRRPKTDIRGQQDLERPIILPAIFTFCNFPFWEPGSTAIHRRITTIVPTRKISGTQQEVIFLSPFYEMERTRVMLATAMVFLATARAIKDHIGVLADFFPSQHIRVETILLHKLWDDHFRPRSRPETDVQTQETQHENIASIRSQHQSVNEAFGEDIDNIKAYVQQKLQPPPPPNDPLPPHIRFFIQQKNCTSKTLSAAALCKELMDPRAFFNTLQQFDVRGGDNDFKICRAPNSKRMLGMTINGMPFLLVRNAGGSLGLFRALAQIAMHTLSDSTHHPLTLRDICISLILKKLHICDSITDLRNGIYTDGFGPNATALFDGDFVDDTSNGWYNKVLAAYGDIPIECFCHKLLRILEDGWPPTALFGHAAWSLLNCVLYFMVFDSSMIEMETHRFGPSADDSTACRMAFIVSYSSCHYEWLVPMHDWAMLVQSAYGEWINGNVLELDSTTEEYIRFLFLQCYRSNFAFPLINVLICRQSTLPSTAASIASSNVFPSVEEVELPAEIVSHNDAIAALIPQRVAVPTAHSEAATQQTTITCRSSIEQYAPLISSFAANGVIQEPHQRGSRSISVWCVANQYCSSAGLPKFKNAQVLSRLVNTAMRKEGRALRIVTKTIQKQKTRHVYWNVKVQNLARQLRIKAPPSNSSDEGVCSSIFAN